MDHLTAWKLAIDGALALSTAYLGIKLWSLQPAKIPLTAVRDLEKSLRALMRDSEESTQQMADEISKKKRQLERLLRELEDREHSISVRSSKAPETEQAVQVASSRVAAAKYETNVSRSATQGLDSNRAVTKRDDVTNTDSEQPRYQSVNIFGEPIISEPTEKKTTLRERVEKLSEDDPVVEDIEEIYSSAAKMLRAGNSLEQVAALSSLPMEEIQRLSKLVSQKSNTETSDKMPARKSMIERERAIL